jgi:Protein of unknown function (DUF3017)
MAEQYESRDPIRGPHVPEPRSHEGGPATGRPRRDDYLDAGAPGESGAPAGDPYGGAYGVPDPAAPDESHGVPPRPAASQPASGDDDAYGVPDPAGFYEPQGAPPRSAASQPGSGDDDAYPAGFYEPQGGPPRPVAAQPVPGPTTPPARGAERVRARSTVPRWLGRLPYAFVLCGVAAGLAVVATNHFRRGSMLIAASVFIGALARLLLPESQVGMLAVRRRWLDVLLMTAAAVGITLVAFVAKGTSG